jgi:dipeptidyl aminopeptidase/acylaminoacyl peptidase
MTISDTSLYRRVARNIFSQRFEAMPVWVDDDLIAWLDDRSGVMQLWTGGREAAGRRQLTHGGERIQTLVGALRSRRVVVGTDLGGNERQQLAVVDLDSGDLRLLTNDSDRIHEPFCLSPDGRQIAYRTNDGASGEFSLYSMPLDDGEPRCLWEDAGQVRAHCLNDQGDALVSVLTSNLDADLFLVASDGTRTPLLESDDESWILDASFLPASDGVLVLTNSGSDFVRLVRIDLRSGQRDTLREESWDIEAMALSPDGSYLAWAVNRDGYSDVCVAPFAALATPTIAALPSGVADRLSWAPAGDRFVTGWAQVDSAARLWTVHLDGHATQTLESDSDDDVYVGKVPELIRFTSFDEREIPAFWFQADRPDAPVVIDVHGGPESQRRAAFHPVLQHLAASGFHVLTTNVRGSTGYGKAYSHLDDVELRMDSVRDLERAHAWVTDRLGGEARIGIMGQSYGGFMTLAAVTEYPTLWFAAVDVVGIANYVTFLERTGSWRRRHREAEYGSLVRHRDLLERISPIRKVAEIEAPLLVIHGRNDPRVPLYEAEQLVAALERRQHPVELLVFDDEGHGLSRRPNRIAAYARVAEFFQKVAEPGASA